MKKLKDFLKKTTTLALGTLTLFGIALSVTSKNSTNIIGANAAGPYYVSGNFNGWSTSNTPMTSMLNSRYFYYEIDYSQTGWNSGNREFKINPNWIGASNLKEYGKMLGFGGSDNITSPSTPEAGAYLLTIRDSSKEINVYKNVYLIGTFNSWKLADASYKMSINAGKFEFTMDLDTSSQFNFVFKNSWDYQIGGDALTQASKDLGFGGTDNITSTSIVPGKYNVTFYPGVNEIDISKPTYTVTKFKGSTQIGTENVWVSEANYKPSFVYQQGYNFEGWYTDVSLTTHWNNEAILGNMNLYGKYTPSSDYYIYFRKPDTWGTSINVHYWWSGSGTSLGDTTTWPGLQMTKVMGTDHGYVAKIDAGYSPNRVMFNDGTNKTEDGGVLLEPGKVYTFNETENKTYALDFEYRIYKGWSPWDDETSTLKENKYKAGESSVTLAVKKGDLVKMNISSQIWAPFN